VKTSCLCGLVEVEVVEGKSNPESEENFKKGERWKDRNFCSLVWLTEGATRATTPSSLLRFTA
jgi:hypothetical protein